MGLLGKEKINEEQKMQSLDKRTTTIRGSEQIVEIVENE